MGGGGGWVVCKLSLVFCFSPKLPPALAKNWEQAEQLQDSRQTLGVKLKSNALSMKTAHTLYSGQFWLPYTIQFPFKMSHSLSKKSPLEQRNCEEILEYFRHTYKAFFSHPRHPAGREQEVTISLLSPSSDL